MLNSKNQATMASDHKFEILVSIPWGTGAQEIQPRLIDYPNFSFVSAEQMRKVYAPVRIRLDAQQGIHVLNDDNRDIQAEDDIFITHFAPAGTLKGKTPLPESQPGLKNRRIIDFAVDQELNSYLLENFSLADGSHNRLTKLNERGQVVWEISGPHSSQVNDFAKLEGEFNQLLIDNQARLYLTSATQPDAIARIDSQRGDIVETYSLAHGSNKAFINGQGSLLRPVYFPQQNKRGLSAFNPSSGEEKVTIGGTELYGLLLYPFGVDDQLNCYVYKLPDNNKLSAIVKISFAGQIVHQENIKDLLVRSSDHAIFTHYTHNDTLEISGYYQDGTLQKWSVRLPANYVSEQFKAYKLIQVDEHHKFYIFTGEAPGSAGKLLIFAENGQLEKEISPPPDLLSLESSLQPFDYWQVDAEGRIYFPLTDPLGFKVVRLTLN